MRNDLDIVRAFEDVETAKTSGRKQFSEMVRWLKKNRSCRILLVEKTDRLYRNFQDAVTLEDLDIEIHLVKESQIISKEAKSQTRFIHGINLVVARNYSENLREEVKKGMLEKARQGIYRATLHSATATIERSGRSRSTRWIRRWSFASWRRTRPVHTPCPRCGSC